MQCNAVDSAKQYFYCEKIDCLILRGFFTSNVQLRPENRVCYREVSTVKHPLNRGLLERNLIGINLFFKKMSTTETCPLYRTSAKGDSTVYLLG